MTKICEFHIQQKGGIGKTLGVIRDRWTCWLKGNRGLTKDLEHIMGERIVL